MFAGIPLTFTLGLNAGAVDQKVQRALRTTIGDIHGQGLLASAQGAEVRHGQVQAGQTQEVLDEAGRLPKGHAEQDLHRQARLDRRVTVFRLPTALVGRWRCSAP